MEPASALFTNAQKFSIKDSNITSAGRDHITYWYNITIIASALSDVGGSNLAQLCKQEGWDKLIAGMEERAKKKKEQKEQDMPINEEALPTQPAVDPNSITRRLVIYTGVDIAKKKLKATVNAVFTLSPAGSTPSGEPWPTIVWKKLSFQPNISRRQDIMWYSETGFSTIKEKAGGVLSPDGLNSVVKPKHVAIFQDDGETPLFSSEEELPMDTTSIAVLNKQPNKQRFALCTIDGTRPETDQFLPVVDLSSLGCDDILVCDPPVMLQAHLVPSTSEYEERNPIKPEILKRPLFSQPVDITKLRPTTSFRLYSNKSGKIILEID